MVHVVALLPRIAFMHVLDALCAAVRERQKACPELQTSLVPVSLAPRVESVFLLTYAMAM